MLCIKLSEVKCVGGVKKKKKLCKLYTNRLLEQGIQERTNVASAPSSQRVMSENEKSFKNVKIVAYSIKALIILH